jgi:hypothetical protein
MSLRRLTSVALALAASTGLLSAQAFNLRDLLTEFLR